jgi:hypothetical protein
MTFCGTIDSCHVSLFVDRCIHRTLYEKIVSSILFKVLSVSKLKTEAEWTDLDIKFIHLNEVCMFLVRQ